MKTRKDKKQKPNLKPNLKPKTKPKPKTKTKVCFNPWPLWISSPSPTFTHANTLYPSPGAPAAKKQKTAPVVVDDDEVENGAEGEEGEEGEEDEEVDEGEDVEESSPDAAADNGPSAAAAKDKGGAVPKESDLPEIEAAEEEK